MCLGLCSRHKISSYRIWRKIKPIVFDAFTENKFHCWFIVDLFIWFRCVSLCCLSYRFDLFCFLFYVLCFVCFVRMPPPKKGEALQPLLKCSALWPMKMFAPFNYYHHCCIYCRFNYKMRLSECVAIGRGSSLWLLSPLQSPLLSPLPLL